MSEQTKIESPATPSMAPEEKPRLDFARWAKRDLTHHRYVYMWADELMLGTQPTDPHIMVLIGAPENGQTELIALHATTTPGPAAWKHLFINLMKHGLIKPPRLAIADAALGFWPAMVDLSHATAKQICWDHQITHVLSLLPKGMRRLAEKELRNICSIPKREDAINAFDLLTQDFQADAPQAAELLQHDKQALLAFYDFPADHWPALQTARTIKSIFEPAGPLKRDESKPIETILTDLLNQALSPQTPWPKLPGASQLSDVLHGLLYSNGQKQAA